jgi:flagellar basal body-associated protein FliL
VSYMGFVQVLVMVVIAVLVLAALVMGFWVGKRRQAGKSTTMTNTWMVHMIHTHNHKFEYANQPTYLAILDERSPKGR